MQEIDIRIDNLIDFTYLKLVEATPENIGNNGMYEDVEIMAVEKNDKIMSFGSEFPDGRLCAESNGKIYRLREAIKMSERLGRPLTDEEYEEFRIKK